MNPKKKVKQFFDDVKLCKRKKKTKQIRRQTLKLFPTQHKQNTFKNNEKKMQQSSITEIPSPKRGHMKKKITPICQPISMP